MYVVRVVPIPRLGMEPFDLGPYRWRWMARLRLRAFQSDSFLRAASTATLEEV